MVKNRGSRKKTSWNKDENQQQIQPTCNAGSGNRAQSTLLEGECLNQCVIPAPQSLKSIEKFLRQICSRCIHFACRQSDHLVQHEMWNFWLSPNRVWWNPFCHRLSLDFSNMYFLLSFLCTVRGLFIVDDKGILRQITINDLPVGRSVDEVLRLVQAFQFTDKHGEGKKQTSFVENALFSFSATLLILAWQPCACIGKRNRKLCRDLIKAHEPALTGSRLLWSPCQLISHVTTK